MSSERPTVSTSPFWLIGAILVLFTILMIWLIVRGDASPSTGPEVETTPIAGGGEIPTSAPTSIPNPPTENPNPTPTQFYVGQQVVLDAGDAGTNNGAVPLFRLYAAPSLRSATYDVYRSGEQFTILEPSGDSDSYPVENENISWVRVRYADGLVGWMDSRYLRSVIP